MRVFAVSDIHIDYSENKHWMLNLSNIDYQQDILILGGDVSDKLSLLELCFSELARKFKKVLFVHGNHELWVSREKSFDSMQKFHKVCEIALDNEIVLEPFTEDELSIVPLQSWYDFSFAKPSEQLLKVWGDFHSCRWPNEISCEVITAYFLDRNRPCLDIKNKTLITFSHFLPRIDLMPEYIPERFRYIYPVLGTNLLEEQVRLLNPDIHVYGHSHVNRKVLLDGIQYINNAFAYPSEKVISNKNLYCIYER